MNNSHTTNASHDESQSTQLQFLYQQRILLFNTRRDHEWKVIFGVITLMFALDAALLVYRIEVDGWKRALWIGLILLPAIACSRYEWVLQKRNFFDRRAMNKLYNLICDQAGIKDTAVREPEHSRSTGMWAFLPQALVLLTVAVFSAVLPWIGLKVALQSK